MGENLFILDFELLGDRSRVLDGRPGIFEGMRLKNLMDVRHQERLDRVVANFTWCKMFQEVDMANEVATFSDHTSLFITINGGPVRR